MQEWALKQGLDANIASMSQAEKTMLRYQYVLANTTAAQGDFAKTANTWANQIRILKQQFEQLASIVGTAFVNMLKPVVQSLNTAMAKVIEFAQTVVNALGKIFGWELEINTKGIAGDFSEAEDAIGGIADGIGDAVSAAKKLNKQLQGFDALNNLSTNIKGTINSILGGIEKMANGVVSGINTVIKAINGLKFDIPDWVPQIGGNSLGFNIPEIKNVSIPKLATGGIVYQATLLEAGEAGAEGILPLTNRAAMSQLVDEIMESAGGNNQYNGTYGAYGQDYSQTNSLLESQNQLLQQQNELLRAILQKPNISNQEAYNAVQSVYTEKAIRKYGTSTPGVPVWG